MTLQIKDQHQCLFPQLSDELVLLLPRSTSKPMLKFGILAIPRSLVHENFYLSFD